MPDSLCTFQPVGVITPINLGNQDAWVEVITDDAVERYIVHAFYLRNEAADAKVGTSATVRGASETYFKTLVQSLGITQADEEEFGGTKYLVPRIGAVSGTLVNPYTGLSVAGLYLVEAEHEDDGYRAYDITLTFIKQRTYSAPNTATFHPDAGSLTALGNGTTYIVHTRTAQAETWAVYGSYKAVSRDAAETYAAGLAAAFNPRDLITTDTPTGQQLVPHPLATFGTLDNPATTLDEDNVYCTQITHDDKGNLHYGISFVFQRSLYASVTDPTSDTRVAKYKSVNVGNRPASITVNVDDPAFISVVVRAEYTGADAITYATDFADDIGYEQIFSDIVPRGGTGARASFRSYAGVAGDLECDDLLTADIEDLFVVGLNVSPAGVDTVLVELSLRKSR